ncbi:MAG TPA: hypothetical protein VIV60_31715 [Polyangiaceae bacterium]
MKGPDERLFSVVSFGLVLGVLFATCAAAGEDRNFAGSAQLDYHFVGREQSHYDQAPGPQSSFRGFTAEAALKIAVDISDHLSANVKVCYGCHGFEADMAYFDYRFADQLNVRFGRFSPTFGAFNLRHDPANHLLSDKPLPYDMGRMLRKGDWNNGVLPSPFPSNGVEVNGTQWVGTALQLDYAAYIVAGFKNNTDPHPTDLNFQESHLPYYVNSNPVPALGGRIGATLRLSDVSDLTLGTSYMLGTYDPQHQLSYAIAGGDFVLRVKRTTLRAEYLARRQQFDVTNPGIFKYAPSKSNGDFFVKHGAFMELELPIWTAVFALGRVDGMFRRGNVGETPVGSGVDIIIGNPLTSRASVLRETLGIAYAVDGNLLCKASIESWQFSYPDANHHQNELTLHLGAVGSF